ARSLMSRTRASYSFCCGVCGGGMNSSLEAIRAGIGGGACWAESRSHWRTHMVDLLGALSEAIPHFDLLGVGGNPRRLVRPNPRPPSPAQLGWKPLCARIDTR